MYIYIYIYIYIHIGPGAERGDPDGLPLPRLFYVCFVTLSIYVRFICLFYCFALLYVFDLDGLPRPRLVYR